MPLESTIRPCRYSVNPMGSITVIAPVDNSFTSTNTWLLSSPGAETGDFRKQFLRLRLHRILAGQPAFEVPGVDGGIGDDPFLFARQFFPRPLAHQQRLWRVGVSGNRQVLLMLVERCRTPRRGGGGLNCSRRSVRRRGPQTMQRGSSLCKTDNGILQISWMNIRAGYSDRYARVSKRKREGVSSSMKTLIQPMNGKPKVSRRVKFSMRCLVCG